MDRQEADALKLCVGVNGMTTQGIYQEIIPFIDSLVSEDESIRNHHRGTCFRVNEDYTKTLEQKLIDIECGECGKNMLECRCEEEE